MYENIPAVLEIFLKRQKVRINFTDELSLILTWSAVLNGIYIYES